MKEIVDEMGYLKKREERFATTNGTTPLPYLASVRANRPKQCPRTKEYKASPGSLLRHSLALGSGKFYISGLSSSVNI